MLSCFDADICSSGLFYGVPVDRRNLFACEVQIKQVGDWQNIFGSFDNKIKKS